MLHRDLRLRWRIAGDLRFQAAILESKTRSFCGISGDLAPSKRKSLAIAIVRFWCAKPNKNREDIGRGLWGGVSSDSAAKEHAHVQVWSGFSYLYHCMFGSRASNHKEGVSQCTPPPIAN